MDGHDTSFPEKEYVLIREYTDQTPFVLAAFQVDSRNADLSLWKTTAVRKDCFPDTDGIRYIIGATPKKENARSCSEGELSYSSRVEYN